MQLTSVEMEELQELVRSDLWPIIEKVADIAVHNAEQNLLNYNGTSPEQDGMNLMILKARIEGARSASHMFRKVQVKKAKK